MELRPEIREFFATHRRVMLSFSGGKDSLTVWCVLRDLGVEVIPFYMQMIPGLPFVEKSIRWYEEHFSTHIIRTQHPNLYHWVSSYAGQPWCRKAGIDLLHLPHFSYEAVEAGVRRKAGLPEDSYTAVGLRSSDSPLRRKRLAESIVLQSKRHVYPIVDFSKQDIVDTLKRHGVKLPIDYKLFGRSFDGVDYRYLQPIREHLPDDYEYILRWLPLQEAEFHRVAWSVDHGQAVVVRPR